ncbi:MAG TPA: ATP-binding cassette domain-containing protein, partial [Candidatus Altiarchaeales archaeon]|nr:ATP-binding cassette domain-containing protein [Candidatus Altiarchaeales archaeon]
MKMRIAVLNKDRCKPKECNYLCQRMCPRVRTGNETIIIDEKTKKPVIIENLCSGCGICVKKCLFDAISIINLPEEIGEPIHQFGINGFRLYNLPTPKKGVVGIVGANGTGKTTTLKILSGELKPNLGGKADWDKIVERFRGHEIQSFLEKLSENEIRAVYKPQYVDSIPRHVKGNVKNIL